MAIGKVLEKILQKYLSILQLRKFKIQGTTIVDRDGLIIASLLNKEIQKALEESGKGFLSWTNMKNSKYAEFKKDKEEI